MTARLWDALRRAGRRPVIVTGAIREVRDLRTGEVQRAGAVHVVERDKRGRVRCTRVLA